MSQLDPSPPSAASPEDASHLQVLGIFYYVFAGLNALSVLFIAAYAVMMAVMFSSGGFPTSPNNPPPPQGFIWMMVGMCVFVILLSLLFGVLHFMTARRLRDRRGLKFCQIVAALTCLSIPFGTVLGVFTFIVLGRPAVKALFEANR